MQAIHFWDMDHTLIDNDCDVSWKEFLIQKKLAPPEAMTRANEFWQQYKSGNLQIDDFIAFQLAEFKGQSPLTIAILAVEHFHDVIHRRIYPQGLSMVNQQHQDRLLLCLITSTNRVIAQPVASYFGFNHLIATEPEICNGQFTGKISGDYCLGSGKLPYMERFCSDWDTTLSHCFYYGDSTADIPIMHQIGYPVAVNPMPALHEEARKFGWKILEFQQP